MTLAFTFPGQGSQSIGMGQALAEAFPSAKAVFEEVNDALDQNLSKLMWDGPIEDLTLTANTQPALMVCGIAAMRALKEDFDIEFNNLFATFIIIEFDACGQSKDEQHMIVE